VADQLVKGENRSDYEDEIKLIDLLFVLWKWKWRIGMVTVAVAVVSIVISFQLPRIYRIEMTIQPGILNVGQDGKVTYIDSILNIKSLIDAGVFDSRLKKMLQTAGNADIPEKLSFKTKISEKTNKLEISYDTPDGAEGIAILTRLKDHLVEYYADRVEYYKDQYKSKIRLKKSEMSTIASEIGTIEHTIRNVQHTISDLETENRFIKANNQMLMSNKENFLKQNDVKDFALSSLLFNISIQQNFTVANDNQKEIFSYTEQLDNIKRHLLEARNRKEAVAEEIITLEQEKRFIRNIEVLKPPARSEQPVRPKKTLIVVLSTIVGFFLMVVIAFLMESISADTRFRTVESELNV